MNTIHMNGYDIDIRRTTDGKYDVCQHCTNGRIGASRMIFETDEELNDYLASKGLDSDVFVREKDADKSTVTSVPESKKSIEGMSAYARLATLFPFLAPERRSVISLFTGDNSSNGYTNLISKGAEIFEKNDIHNVNDYVDKYRELNEEFTQMLLPRSMRKEEYKDVFMA